jgi:molybdenum cofactor biosynthesis enzyme MoaA
MAPTQTNGQQSVGHSAANASALRDQLVQHNQFGPGQLAGTRWSIGCVSLEVTQRCNLDCSLCYLSELSEAVHDVPLQELFRRIEQVAQVYGPNTDIQISGGDPTLRPLSDLVAIIELIKKHKMRCSLFTNGILASRSMLETLRAAGLDDVAFHVDMTQERKNYNNETELNALRKEYLQRARGLGLSVYFNTTIFDGNLAQIPDLMRFFVQHADEIDFVSFQMQADTGRGVLRERASQITQKNVEQLIARGAGSSINFDALQVGHPQCSRFGYVFVSGNEVLDALHETKLAQRFMQLTAGVVATRDTPVRTALRFIRAAAAGGFFVSGLSWLARMGWRLRSGLTRGRFRVNKLSIMTHNFMDASALDKTRLDCCVFMAAGIDGPVPMCQYNAQRDQYLLKPVSLSDGTHWNPLQGRDQAHQLAAQPTGSEESSGHVPTVPIKWLKGRPRQLAMAARKSGEAI